MPLSNSMSSRFAARFSRNSTGQGPLSLTAAPTAAAGVAAPSRRLSPRPQRPRLVHQHDRDAVADRIGQPGFLADQLLRGAIIAQRPLGQRTNQDFEKFRIDIGGIFHRRSVRLDAGEPRQCRVPRVLIAGHRLDRGHFDEPGQQRRALFEIGRFEQGLLLVRRERTSDRDRGDKLFGRRLLDRAPIGRKLPLAEKILQAADEAGAVELRRVGNLAVRARTASNPESRGDTRSTAAAPRRCGTSKRRSA